MEPARFRLQKQHAFLTAFNLRYAEINKDYMHAAYTNDYEKAEECQQRLKSFMQEAIDVIDGKISWDEIPTEFKK